MKTVKRSLFCGTMAINSFANRNAYLAKSNEAPQLEDAEENLQIKSNESNEAYAKLAEIINQIQQTITNNVRDTANSIEILKSSIEQIKKNREGLIRTELDTTDAEQKRAIDKKIEQSHNSESDSQIKLNLLNEKLEAAQSIPNTLKEQLDVALDEAKRTESSLASARSTCVDALDNKVSQLLSEAYTYVFEFAHSNSKADDMVKTAGLVPEKKKVKPVQTQKPGQYSINPVTGKEINPFSALEAKQLENYYNR